MADNQPEFSPPTQMIIAIHRGELKNIEALRCLDCDAGMATL